MLQSLICHGKINNTTIIVCAIISITGRSSDGQTLVASSSDGYCTIVRFDDSELGAPLANNELPVGVTKVAPTNIDVTPPAMDTMPLSNQTTPHRGSAQVTSTTENFTNGSSRKPGPRRVQLITLSTTPKSVATATATTSHDTSDSSGKLVPTTDTIVIL